ncbi:hypothetical protein FQN49_002240 [Arthroderma sp. PD_2]|nr:hypothetical protein FQN49_002240 [Arthroderma sp. PD_2]
MVIPARSRSAITWSTPGLDEPARPLFSSPTSSSPSPHAPFTDRGTPSSILSSQNPGTNLRDPQESLPSTTNVQSDPTHIRRDQNDEHGEDVLDPPPGKFDSRQHEFNIPTERQPDSHPNQEPSEPPDPPSNPEEVTSQTRHRSPSDLDPR